MKNSGNVVPRKYDFLLLVAQKIGGNRTSFHKVRLSESKMKSSSNNFMTRTLLCLICCFAQKYRPGTLVLVKQAFCITPSGQNSNGENCSDKWLGKLDAR